MGVALKRKKKAIYDKPTANIKLNGEIKEEIKKNNLRQMTKKTQPHKIYGMSGVPTVVQGNESNK